MKALALAVPKATQTEQSRRLTVLRGAPWAFARNTDAGFDDTHTLREWFAKNASFTPDIVDQVVEYFSHRPGAEVRSVMSLFLRTRDVLVGVLNLHCSQPFMLGAAASADRKQIAEDRQQTWRRREPCSSHGCETKCLMQNQAEVLLLQALPATFAVPLIEK